MFKTIKRFFDLGIWAEKDVAKWVKLKKITAEQYKEITGLDYVEE